MTDCVSARSIIFQFLWTFCIAADMLITSLPVCDAFIYRQIRHSVLSPYVPRCIDLTFLCYGTLKLFMLLILWLFSHCWLTYSDWLTLDSTVLSDGCVSESFSHSIVVWSVGDTTLPADQSYTYLNVDDAKDLRYRKVTVACADMRAAPVCWYWI